MAEYKQYITQIQENGNVMISESVIATIAEHALQEVDGIVSLVTKPGADIADAIGMKNWGSGLKIQIAEDNSITIGCNVTISYGYGIVDVADAAQKAVSSAVESVTGVPVESVNVNVCGIVHK